MTLAMFCSFQEFPKINAQLVIRAKNRFVNNGTANCGRNIPTEISGTLPEAIPNIPVGRNQNGPFHFSSDQNFRNLCHINGSTKTFFSRSSILVPRPRRLRGAKRASGEARSRKWSQPGWPGSYSLLCSRFLSFSRRRSNKVAKKRASAWVE